MVDGKETTYFDIIVNRDPGPSCVNNNDCATGYLCIDGTCKNFTDTGANDTLAGMEGPGDCDLDEEGDGDKTESVESCNEEEASPGGEACQHEREGDCGKPLEPTADPVNSGLDCCGGKVFTAYVVNPDGTESLKQSCTEPPKPEPEDPEDPVDPGDREPDPNAFEVKCDTYADSYYKANGEIPEGYTNMDICNSCQECFGGQCSDLDGFSDCYCTGGSLGCRDREGPCFDCDFDTGICEETCFNCVAECDFPFKCPCDREETGYTSSQTFNPCKTYTVGPGSESTCWKKAAEDIKAFCELNHPCEDEDDNCLYNCTNVKSSSPYNCPAGHSCKQKGVITNEETGEKIYLTRKCEVREGCGCAGEPGDPGFVRCGACESCVGGVCEYDFQKCGASYTGAGTYTVKNTEIQIGYWKCTDCNGSDTNPSTGEPWCPNGVAPQWYNEDISYTTYDTDENFAYEFQWDRGSYEYGTCSDCYQSEDLEAGSVLTERAYQVNGEGNRPLFVAILSYETILVKPGTGPEFCYPTHMLVLTSHTFTSEVIDYDPELALPEHVSESQYEIFRNSPHVTSERIIQTFE